MDRSGWLRDSYSLRTHLIVFGLAILLPVTILAGLLLVRSAALERTQLEARLIQVADDLADDIDREIDRHFTVLRTLARLPSLAAADWPMFYEQAKGAVEGRGYVIVIDSSLKQLVNTLLPYGSAPARTGDPDTARRMLANKEPANSDLFVSLIDQKPVFNVNLPIVQDGQVRYILIFGQLAEQLQPILTGQRLGSEWITTVLDRKGAILSRSKSHEPYVGKIHPEFASDIKVSDRSVRQAMSLEGQPVLRATVRCKLSGWLVAANIPLSIAEASLRTTAWSWGLVTLLAIAIAAGLAWLFARVMTRPMAAAAEAAVALGQERPIPPLYSTLREANAIVTAQQRAQSELAERSEHQRLLLNELSHRVKNVLAVVQSLVLRTLSGQRSMGEAREILTERILALGRAHEVLMRTDWKGAPLRDIVNAELAPFGGRVSCAGPDLTVHGAMVQTLALVLHELATNAAKYGALSDSQGTVSISWSIANGHFRFQWKEQGGPPIKPAGHKGFGTNLLETVVSADADLKPRLSFEPDGLSYEFETPLEMIS